MPRPTQAPGSDDVEILVHVMGPAGAADDKQYRALAAAYLQFQASSTVSLWNSSVAKNADIGFDAHHTPSNSQDYFQSSAISPQLSFTGAWGNVNSPRLRMVQAHQVKVDTSLRAHDLGEEDIDGEAPHDTEEVSPNTPSSWVQPPSEVADSMPGHASGLLEYSSPSRLIEHFMGFTPSSQLEPTSQVLSSPSITHISRLISTSSYAAPTVSSDGLLRSASAGWGDVSDTREMGSGGARPDPHNAADTPAKGSSDTADNFVKEMSSPLKKRPNASELPRADSEPPSIKRHKASRAPSSPGPLMRSTSDTGPGGALPPMTKNHPLVLKNSRPAVYLCLLEIDAPGPPPGMTEIAPESLVTANLSALAQSLGLGRRFRPVEQRRDLRPFERGYWLLECGGWDQALVQRTWGFLHNYVSRGLAGWGTRCVRDEGWQWLRVWCFGHVVGHVYLLLYLASERKLKCEGTSWIDGGGETVLVTDGHP